MLALLRIHIIASNS